MSTHSRFVLLSGVLLFTLLLSLVSPMSVYADDGAPPSATEEPVQPPVEGEAEIVPEEANSVSPSATEEPAAVATEPPIFDRGPCRGR